MKKIFFLFFFIIILNTYFISLEKSIPGIKTVKKYGTKLSPNEIINKIGQILSGMDSMGRFSYDIYYDIINTPNDDPVFIIEKLELNDNGLATNIEGHIEIPHTFRDYVIKGGLGIPIYEEVPPNEFGVIFGRPGNIALREGTIVKKNPLEDAEIYEIQLGSDTYDKIARASMLFQAYEIIRTPYLENTIIELQGMLLNSKSKDAILEGIRNFKNEHKKMSEAEIIVNFLKVNKTYLNEIKKSNKETRKRIKESREMLDAISNACALQVGIITELFGKMAEDIAYIFLDPFSAPSRISRYIERNVPSKYHIKFKELEDIRRYCNYQTMEYNKNWRKNQKLWKAVMEITKDIY